MTHPTTDPSDPEAEPTNARSRALTAASSIAERSRDGSLATFAGGALLARALLFRRNRRRAVMEGLAGAMLVGIGLRQRRPSGSPLPTRDTERDRGETGTSEERADSHQPEASPRGTADEPEVETASPADEGGVRFTEDQDEGEGSTPQLDESVPGDPRLDTDDESTDVDLSSASLADEASEATGPAAEQAQPTQTESTEPERSPEEDAANASEDGAAEADDEEGEPTDESDDPT